MLQVILAASICTRGGKAILSRQFRDISKARIEGLLAAFSQLTSTEAHHTTIETDYIRYVYQPLEELYMILITNLHSNILHDINTLHLFTQTVVNICRSYDEQEILRNAFELLNAFDEITSFGYQENLSFAQIKSFLEMDSHEEKIQEIIAKNKELEAGEERKRRVKQFELQRKESSKKGFSNFQLLSNNQYQLTSYSSYNTDSVRNVEDNQNQINKPSTLKGKGMHLGKKPRQFDLYETTKHKDLKEHIFIDVAAKNNVNNTIFTEDIQIKMYEDIYIVKTRDNIIENLEIKGDLHLHVLQQNVAFFRLFLCDDENKEIEYKIHPNVNKSQFLSDKIIAHRDSTKPFPVNTSLGVLKWRIKKNKEINLPFNVNIQSYNSNGYINIYVEYELTSNNYELENVIIFIPFQSYSAIQETSEGITVNHEKKFLEWQVSEINYLNKSDSKNFTIKSDNIESCFPISVNFSMKTLIFNIDVVKAELVNTGKTLSFSKSIAVSGKILIK
ncbi:unnamed protein product [Pneumocystis jirovecii]|uniref:Coatomer subunit delta n=2 Tax=Pneumocystis jirovecii TaxID=42068 RepID=L0PF79_PNEJI|nr:coatomer subunit delta [Pneumocystis jirovecii RU7]KTW31732.1 hypothetical protein T551_00993 [Pneumocystis jirovecii RU7]CCJ30295.1 unnamed protein product [Pneumocystis jirovecii]